jgi:ClpP class serine protease
MVKSRIPVVLACHPAWSGEIERISHDANEQKAFIAEQDALYKGPAANLAGSFDPNDVYQINEREYYSYGDGLRYYMSDDNKRIAMIPVSGPLWSSRYKDMAAMVKAAENPAYHGAILMANTPGGHTRGMDRLAKAIAGYSKKIGVYVSGNLNSAGAYITAGADFIVGDPEEKNSFGSIGVFAIIDNEYEKNEKDGVKVAIIRSEGADMKAKPNPYEPWDEEAVAKIQESVNKDGAAFLNAMSALRGITEDNMEKIKTGEEFDNEQAMAYGLIDGLATFEDAIERVATKSMFI